LRKKIKVGLIYIVVPVRKENYPRLAKIIKDNLDKSIGKLMVVYEDYAEIISL